MASDTATEKFLKYPPSRDIVFVLGAGASHPDGVPLQEDILPMIISGDIGEIAGSAIGRQITQFILDNFYINPRAQVYPRLEAVFGFLDYFIQRNESLSSTYDTTVIRQLKENLIKAIHFIVNLQSDRRSLVYHRFWRAACRHNRNISIITLNYDTLLEQAFDFLYRTCGYIDYCIHLLNYEKLPRLRDVNFWVNPREPIAVQPGDTPVPFKIIKIHGSLNWKYCNCCNQVLLTPWDRIIDLNRGKLIGHTYPDAEQYDYNCPIDGTDFQTLIMPPSYIKSLTHPIITQLFGEASIEIRATRKIVFIGYSLSNADVHIKALFRKNLRTDTSLVVVNTKPADDLLRQYYALSSKVRYICSSFEEIVNDDQTMRDLLS